eukprot:7861880-Lingulodinium_polyedra.AAC.1
MSLLLTATLSSRATMRPTPARPVKFGKLGGLTSQLASSALPRRATSFSSATPMPGLAQHSRKPWVLTIRSKKNTL